MKLSKVASALSFAHLAGLGRGKAAKAEDDDKKDRDREDVTDGAKKGKAEGDDPEDDDKTKKGPDAEDDDPDAEEDDPEKKDDDEDKKSAKGKAKADDDRDSDDEKMKAGAKRERARCAAIFASPAAAKNVTLAAELAFNTDLTAAQATAILSKTPAATGNPNRAAGNPRIAGSGAPEVTGKQAVDSSWDRAFAKVSPQKRR